MTKKSGRRKKYRGKGLTHQKIALITIAIVIIGIAFGSYYLTREGEFKGIYIELEGNVNLTISEKFTKEKDGAHIFLNLATEKEYPNYNYLLNSDVEIRGSFIMVEVKNVFIPWIVLPLFGPATFFEDLGKIEGDYILILRHRGENKYRGDSYSLKITKDKIEINPITQTFTIHNQSTILYRVPENVIWIHCGHYDRVGCENNQEYIKIRERFFKEPLISNLQPFEPENGEYVLSNFKGVEGWEYKHFKFHGDISGLEELVENYSVYTSRDINDNENCLLLSIRTWKGDFFHTW